MTDFIDHSGTRRRRVADDDGIGALLTRVVADAQQVVRAEIDLQKARAAAKISAARNGAILLVAALMVGSLALIGLVVGALLILQRPLGPAWATVIVAGVLLAATGLLGWLGVRQFKLLFGAGKTS